MCLGSNCIQEQGTNDHKSLPYEVKSYCPELCRRFNNAWNWDNSITRFICKGEKNQALMITTTKEQKIVSSEMAAHS